MPTCVLPHMSECFFEFLRRGWEEGTHTTKKEQENHFQVYCRVYSLSVFSLAEDLTTDFGNQRNLQD